ncbi:Rv0804 family intramembrane glutamic endopeptidase [Mycobacterium sp. HUMS_1102779]|uniref:Rv0804 family intramembrane glutamic endopeptidase n=1 Tax=Mycobacterium sp. HUMS_1102779 TaxID=3383487 RepID=UPI003899E1CE
MPERPFRRPDALSLAAALVGWGFVAPRLRSGWRAVVQAGVGALLVRLTRAPLGLRPPRLWTGLRWGAAAGAAAAAVIAGTTAFAPVRLSMSARQLPASTPAWLLLRIPVGTVWAEEAAFRAALAHLAARAAGDAVGGRLLQAGAFGLFHIPDARATGEPVAATVLATGLGGWAFGWLADRSGSLAAPMLAHLAVNEAGAIAASLVQRSRVKQHR